jgi:hypothetical protein
MSRFIPVAGSPFGVDWDFLSELEARESDSGVEDLMERGLEGVVEGVGFEGVIKDDLDGVALNL